jgi:hypothetical protein
MGLLEAEKMSIFIRKTNCNEYTCVEQVDISVTLHVETRAVLTSHAEVMSRLGYDLFLPNPSHFIKQSSYHSTF